MVGPVGPPGSPHEALAGKPTITARLAARTMFRIIALTGVLWMGWVRPSVRGSAPSRPIENMTRTVALWQARQTM